MNRTIIRAALGTLLLLAIAGCGKPDAEPASLAIIETRMWTGDAEKPWADAVAVRGDRIVAVGSNEEIAPLIGNATRVLTIPDGLVVPGFIDAHVHFARGGAVLASVQLRDVDSREAFVRRIEAFASKLEPGDWILGGTWDHENWGGELPTKDWIDPVTPENPVWIMRLDGHMGLANSLALEIARVGADTPDIDGGAIVRDADGKPTGILKDNAMVLVNEVVPPPGDEMLERHIAAAMAHVASNGITTVHDMSEDSDFAWAKLEAYRRLHARGDLRTRIRAHPPLPDWQRLADDIDANGRGDDWLRTGGLKGFMDGSLGSHTAAFFEPYTDAPGDRGLLLNDLADMQRWVDAADEAGLQVAVHAIGDRAIAELLDIFGRVAAANGERDRRFRMEHAQHIHPDDIPRFAAQGVIASMQPYHAIDDGRWAGRVIGAERARTTYAFASLLESGATLAFGSDWYVAPADPIAGIYAAVTRRTLDGNNPGGWVPAQKITAEQALNAYTVDAAYAAFDENSIGMIREGMLADLVLLDRNLLEVAPASIRDTRVLVTIVGGDVVYERDAPAASREELTGFARRYAEAWSSGDPESLAAFYAENGALSVNDGEPAAGRAAIAATADSFMQAFPDMTIELVELRRAGDAWEFHWHWTGTNTGPGGTGNAVDLVGYEVWTLDEDGLILESLGHYDEKAYRRQVSDVAASPN